MTSYKIIDCLANRTCLMCYAALASLWLTVFTSPIVLAQTPAQIDAVVLDEMAKQNIVGMVVGIVINGRIGTSC